MYLELGSGKTLKDPSLDQYRGRAEGLAGRR